MLLKVTLSGRLNVNVNQGQKQGGKKDYHNIEELHVSQTHKKEMKSYECSLGKIVKTPNQNACKFFFFYVHLYIVISLFYLRQLCQHMAPKSLLKSCLYLLIQVAHTNSHTNQELRVGSRGA